MRTLACALLLAASAAGAQTRPDLSGVWVRVDTGATRPSVATVGDAAFRTGNMGSGWGTPLTLSARADSLVVEFPYFEAYDIQPPIRYAYALSGAESRNVLMVGHSPEAQRGRLVWRGDTLVITTLHPLPPDVGARGATTEVRQTLWLAGATTLTVETTRVGVMGGPTTTVRTTYNKR